MPIHGYTGNIITANPTAPTVSAASGVWTTEQQLQAIAAGNWPGYEYPISRSLRFNSADSAYLNRTPASASNQTTWTWSGWVKRGQLGTEQHLFGSASASTNNFQFFFSTSDTLYVNAYIGASTAVVRTANAVFRDPSAWYHIVLVADTNNATQANRMLIYVNGVSQSFSTSYALTSGQTFSVNSTVAHYIGKYALAAFYIDAYLAEVNFIDGRALS